jgi:hypothetical protein
MYHPDSTCEIGVPKISQTNHHITAHEIRAGLPVQPEDPIPRSPLEQSMVRRIQGIQHTCLVGPGIACRQTLIPPWELL